MSSGKAAKSAGRTRHAGNLCIDPMDIAPVLSCLAGPAGLRGADLPIPSGPFLLRAIFLFPVTCFRKGRTHLRPHFSRQPMETPAARRRHGLQETRLPEKASGQLLRGEPFQVSDRIGARRTDTLAGHPSLLGFRIFRAAGSHLVHASLCAPCEYAVHPRAAVQPPAG